ncbi:hypothetical protein [Actinotalea sp.]|uniref:hypothetical protein n=1 Tax=Actinotalea sp. TaxID=1872145 RepID=UPI003562642C
MSNVVHPVGPRPPRVYWVRRIVAAIALLAVIAVLWTLVLLVLRLVGGTDDGAAAAAEPSPSETAAASGPAPCQPSDLEMSVTATAQSYPAGTNPEFTVGVVNAGASSCTFDPSGAQREVTITSGSDRVWSSADCQAEGSEDLLLLATGASAPATVSWDRSRSAEGCPEGLPEPRPGTYRATATVLGVTLPEVVFTLE